MIRYNRKYKTQIIANRDLPEVLETNGKVFIHTTGAPGSGKTYHINKTIPGTTQIDIDEIIKTRLGGDYSPENFKKAQQIARQLEDVYLKSGQTFVRQGVGAILKWVLAANEKAKEYGYVTVLYFVDISFADTISQNQKRFISGERDSLVPLKDIKWKYKNVNDNFNFYRKHDGIFDYIVHLKIKHKKKSNLQQSLF